METHKSQDPASSQAVDEQAAKRAGGLEPGPREGGDHNGAKDSEEEKPQQPACFQVVCCFCFVSCFIFAKEGEGTDSFLGLQMETQEWWAKRSQETDLSSVSGRTSYQWVHLAREWISRGCDQKRKLESSEMLGGVPARVGGRTRWSGRLHFNAHTLS